MFSLNHLFAAIPISIVFCLHCSCSAFLTRPPGRLDGGSNNYNGGVRPPQSSNFQNPDWEDHHVNCQPLLAADIENATRLSHVSTNNVREDAPEQTNKNVKVTKNILASIISYWSHFFQKAGQSSTAPFLVVKQRIASALESEEQQAKKEILFQLQTMKVQHILLPNTTVVPNDVIQLAARRSGLIGNPFRMDRVQEFAASLKRWYQMRGYVLHSVTGATVRAESAAAEIHVQEPHVSTQPVAITFYKEMVVDEETGNLLTFRQHNERHMKRRSVGHKAISKVDINTTFVQTAGKTRPDRIAKALDLQPGHHFRWDGSKWNTVSRSGIFGRILQVSPQRMRDGTVQLQILATEAAPRHLEYGVSKSLYTGFWEGEVNFQHQNLFGGGESFGLMVRRGTHDPEPSVRLCFTDGKFGLPGGYDVEAFSDFIGDQPEFADQRVKVERQMIEENDEPHKRHTMLDRRGIKLTYRNPLNSGKIRFSSASTSLERTATLSGIREAIACGTLALEPVQMQLPLEARANIDGSFTTGLRIPEPSSHIKTETGSGLFSRDIVILPYSSFTVTVTQVLPLLVSSKRRRGTDNFSLALRHSLSGSTRNLPRHEQTAMGFSSMVRGGTPNGGISTSVAGTTELRVPLQLDFGLPAIRKFQDGFNIVFFGDWVSARKNNKSPFFFEKSIGVGIRKVSQGIPFKLDFSYAGTGMVKARFGLGRDFDV